MTVSAAPTVGVAASFTPQPLEPYVGAALLEAGLAAPRVVFADFNQIHQVCLDPLGVFGAKLDRLALLWRVEDVFEAQFLAAAEGDPGAASDLLDGVADLVASIAQSVRREGIPTVVSIPPTPDGFGLDRLDPVSSAEVGRLHDRVAASSSTASRASTGSGCSITVDSSTTWAPRQPTTCADSSSSTALSNGDGRTAR